MISSALQDLREMDLAGAVKTFKSTNGNGPGKPFPNSKALNDAQDNLEKAGHHKAAAQDHAVQAVQAKGMGNKTLAAAHTDLAAAHSSLADTHAAIAKHAMKTKPVAQPLGESGFGVRTVDPEDLYKPFDPRENIDFTPTRPKSQHFTVSDLRRVVETVCQEHHSVLQVLRFDHDDAGFIGQVTSGAGFPGTSPSCTQLEQAFVQKIRYEHTTGVVELLDQTDIPPTAPGGYSSRKSVWRFSLKAKKNVW